MPPHTAYFNSSITLDVSCHDVDPCFSSSSKGPLSAFVDPSVCGTSSIQRKSVSFNRLVRAKKTIHISDFSKEEIRCCWYQEKDYEMMQTDIRLEVNRLENDHHDDCCLVVEKQLEELMTRTTTRGLEVFSLTERQVRQEIKHHAWTAVLEEQRLQREEGSYDPDFIADIYSAVTKAATQIAIAAAH